MHVMKFKITVLLKKLKTKSLFLIENSNEGYYFNKISKMLQYNIAEKKATCSSVNFLQDIGGELLINGPQILNKTKESFLSFVKRDFIQKRRTNKRRVLGNNKLIVLNYINTERVNMSDDKEIQFSSLT